LAVVVNGDTTDTSESTIPISMRFVKSSKRRPMLTLPDLQVRTAKQGRHTKSKDYNLSTYLAAIVA
jgi:hypothetical protein